MIVARVDFRAGLTDALRLLLSDARPSSMTHAELMVELEGSPAEGAAPSVWATLSKLVARGEVVRVAPATYVATGTYERA